MDIKDISLAPSGADKIAWVESYMPILNQIRKSFEKEKPFCGKKIAMSIHLEAKTAYLAKVLHAGGAEIHITGCNPLSTQDDVAAALAAEGFDVHARRGVDDDEYREHLIKTLACCPDLMIDDGGDLTSLLHGVCRNYGRNLIGGCEETTTGIHRLLARERAGKLDYTMIDVNDADCKHMFDNRYGTGQSVWDGICRTTNLIVAGKYVVISGYGWCGKGVTLRAKGLGAKVIVTETDPIRALEAVMDGYEVMPMAEAAKIGDIFCTVTGGRDIITAEHFPLMKDGAILSNAGHFNIEVDMEALEEMAVRKYEARHNIQGYVMPNGKTLFTIAEGRLVNLAAADGHPAEIMDMSFAIQALSAEYLAKHRAELVPGVISVPRELDEAVARRKLRAMGVSIDSLSPEQEDYLGR